MYVCLHCGHRFANPVKYQYNKSVRMYDDDAACPNCGSEDFEQAGHCLKCGEDFQLDEMVGSICKGCVEKAMTLDNLFKYANERGISTDDFLDEFETLLSAHLKRTDELTRKFLYNDVYDFSEWLEKED